MSMLFLIVASIKFRYLKFKSVMAYVVRYKKKFNCCCLFFFVLVCMNLTGVACESQLVILK